MNMEQLKAAIAALSTTPELEEENKAAIATFQTQLQAIVDEDEDDDSEESEAKPEELTPEEQALIDTHLKKMKDNMDKMSGKLREQARAAAQAEATAKAAEITRLKEDGKIQEALELELEAAKAKLLLAEESNTKLTRDSTMETVLAAYDFRNARSRAHAKRDITDELVQVDGEWQHKSGISIAAAVEAYALDNENKYLFKSKTNKGGGTQVQEKPIDTTTNPKSLFELTGAQMLERAAKGQLGKMNY